MGVDAGATKSVALAVTPGGRLLGRAEAEGANPKRHGLAVAADRIAAVATRAAGAAAVATRAAAGTSTAAGVPALVFVAGAGIDRPEHARALEAALRERLPGACCFVVNDTLAVLRAGTRDAVGLVVPVSTGGNVIGRAADGRITDRGHGIFGGGYVLGALAARAVMHPTRHAKVGAGLAGRVTQAHLQWTGRRPSPEAAHLGAAVAEAAEAGDPYPARIVARWCGRIETAIREEIGRLDLGSEPEVIIYGGLLDAAPWLGARVTDAILRGAPGAHVRHLNTEPAAGAALLASDAWAGTVITWDFRPRR